MLLEELISTVKYWQLDSSEEVVLKNPIKIQIVKKLPAFCWNGNFGFSFDMQLQLDPVPSQLHPVSILTK
jgi:hypothetical protein